MTKHALCHIGDEVIFLAQLLTELAQGRAARSQ